MQRNVTAERVQTQLKTCCLALDQITHGSTVAIEHGSQACCLAGDSSDIDILLCVHGLDSQCCPKAKESQKEYAKDLFTKYATAYEVRAAGRTAVAPRIATGPMPRAGALQLRDAQEL